MWRLARARATLTAHNALPAHERAVLHLQLAAHPWLHVMLRSNDNDSPSNQDSVFNKALIGSSSFSKDVGTEAAVKDLHRAVRSLQEQAERGAHSRARMERQMTQFIEEVRGGSRLESKSY